MVGEPYLRKKGNKWIIEKKVDGKTKYIMTLPPLKDIIKWKRPDALNGKASQSNQDLHKELDSMFAETLLSEPQEWD